MNLYKIFTVVDDDELVSTHLLAPNDRSAARWLVDNKIPGGQEWYTDDQYQIELVDICSTVPEYENARARIATMNGVHIGHVDLEEHDILDLDIYDATYLTGGDPRESLEGLQYSWVCTATDLTHPDMVLLRELVGAVDA